MTKEELEKKIEECEDDSRFFEDIDEYYWGKAEGMIEVYTKWLKELTEKEDQDGTDRRNESQD